MDILTKKHSISILEILAITFISHMLAGLTTYIIGLFIA